MRVPEGHRGPFVALARLPEPDADELLTLVEGQPRLQTRRALSDRLAAAHIGADIDVAQLVRAAFGLATQTKYHGRSLQDLAAGVARSEDLSLDAAERDALEQRLLRLLEADAILLSAKAADLQVEHERIFHDVRVLTDIRPVFPQDPSESPVAAVVNEILRIEYFEAGETHALHVALDRNDLVRLQQVIDRAITKTESLTRYLDGIGLGYFELEQQQ